MNILDEVQHFVADRLNERLSAYCRFIPENAKTVDYEIKKHLGEQGVVGLVLTPKAQYAGAFEDVGIAWEIPELEVDVVENPTVNRGRALSAVMTGQDLGMAAFDVLCPLSGEGEGRFCPVSYEEGEDGSLLVNRCVVKCLAHPAPPPPPFDPDVNYAVFSDGTKAEGWENTWSSAEQFSQFCFEHEPPLDPYALVEAYVYQDFVGFEVFANLPVLKKVVFGPQVATIEGAVFDGNGALTSVYFKGKTLAEVQAMRDYPWGLDDVSIIEAELPPGPGWLRFTALEPGSSVRLDKSRAQLSDVSLETSTDGIYWTDYGWSGNTGDEIALADAGDFVWFRAKDENQTFTKNGGDYYRFRMSGRVKASGSVQSLLDPSCERADVPDDAFNQLFAECSALTEAPELPATELGRSCYSRMFENCVSLRAAPLLPARRAAYFNYANMFRGCSALVSADVRAEELSSFSCDGMFWNCASLSSVSARFADWNDCTGHWLQNVAAEGVFRCPSALDTETRDGSHVPPGWEVERTDA